MIVLYYKVHNYPSKVTHLDNIETTTIWSLELVNIKELCNKLIESEKITWNIIRKKTVKIGKWVNHSTILKRIEKLHLHWLLVFFSITWQRSPYAYLKMHYPKTSIVPYQLSSIITKTPERVFCVPSRPSYWP